MNDLSKKKGKKIQKNLSQTLLLKPDSFSRYLWELFFVGTVMILGILIPIDAAFFDVKSEFSQNLSIFTSCLYFMDILITLNTGLYIKGEPILKRSTILTKYLSFHFWVDLISTVPFDLLIIHSFFSDSKTFSNQVLSKLLKLFRLVRLTRIEKALLEVEGRLIRQTSFFLLKIVKIFYYLFLVANGTACLMFFVSSRNLEPDSFVGLMQNRDEIETRDVYVTSLYWAFVTMVSIGYGDLHPRTTAERIVGILIMNCSSVTFGFLAGNFGDVVAKTRQKDRLRRGMIANVNKFMKNHGLGNDIKRRSVNYINYLYSKSNNRIDLQVLLQDLSFALKEEIFTHINGKLVEGFLVFEGLGFKCISRISRILEPQVNSPNEVIFQENEEALNMFFITKGVVQVIDLKTASCISFLSKNEHFGEIGMLMKKPRSAGIYSVIFTETLCLHLASLEKVSKQFPVLKEKLEKIQESADKQDISVLGISCYLCKGKGHLAKNCEIMTEKQKNKMKWLAARNKTQVLGVSNHLFKIAYKKQQKKLDFGRIYTKNVFGKKRGLKELYPLQQNFRNFIRSSSANFNYQESCVSPRISLFSRDEEVSEYLNSFRGYEQVVDSDEELIVKQDRIRSKGFDLNLLRSTWIKSDE
jgi:hypothetical protein